MGLLHKMASLYAAQRRKNSESAGIGTLRDNGVKFRWYDWLVPGMDIAKDKKTSGTMNYANHQSGFGKLDKKHTGYWLARAMHSAGKSDTDLITVGDLRRARQMALKFRMKQLKKDNSNRTVLNNARYFLNAMGELDSYRYAKGLPKMTLDEKFNWSPSALHGRRELIGDYLDATF